MSFTFINQFQISSKNNDSFHYYLGDIFEDISRPSLKMGLKGVDLIAFHDFSNFPMLISEKIFNAINKENHLIIQKEEFVTGMETVFCVNSIDFFAKLLFNILDFKLQEKVYVENIIVFFSQFHIMMCNNNDTLGLNEIITNAIGEDCASMNYDLFINRLKDNADVLYLFMIFIYQRFHNEKESIDYYANVICRDILDVSNIKRAENNNNNIYNNYADPSKLLLKYINDQLNINYGLEDQDDYFYLRSNNRQEQDLEENNKTSFNEYFDNETNELSELEDFENDIQSCMLKNSMGNTIRQSFTLSYTRNQTEKQRSMKPIEPIDLTLLNQAKQATSAFLVHAYSNKPEVNKSNKKNEFICESKPNIFDPAHLQKQKMILIGNSLFYFIYADHLHSYIYSGVHYLQKNYLIIKSSSQDSINNKYQVSLISDYGGLYKLREYTFDDQSNCQSFCDQIIKTISYRDINNDIVIKDEINSGSCGNIFTGYSNRLKKKVVIKIINKKNKTKAELKLIRWEKDIIQYMAHVCHKNIMEAYDTYEDDSNIYLILEYIDGQSLSSNGLHIRYDKKVIMHQVVEAIEFLHKNNIIHRDIKPCNIMLKSNEKTIKVVDFGFARILSKKDYASEYCGSLNFSAPEVVLNKPYNRSIDIWSLGVLLFWLQYETMPFESSAHDIKGTSINIINRNITNLQGGYLKDQLMNYCFQLDPKERTSFESIYDMIVY